MAFPNPRPVSGICPCPDFIRPFPSTEIRKTAHPLPPRAKWPVKTAGRIFLFCLSVSARPSRTDCPDARPVCRTGAVVNAGNRRFCCKASDTPGTNQVIHTGSVPRTPSGLPQANAGLADAKPTGLARTAPLSCTPEKGGFLKDRTEFSAHIPRFSRRSLSLVRQTASFAILPPFPAGCPQR